MTFGLADKLPGLKNFLTLSGPFEFASGFLSGTEVSKDEFVWQCEKLLMEDIIDEAELLANMTITTLITPDIYQNVFNAFDIVKIMLRMTK